MLDKPVEMGFFLSLTLLFVPTINAINDQQQQQQEHKQYHNWVNITDEVRIIFVVINRVIVMGAMCLFGISTNVVNILVFCKQDMTNTVNISLLGLAVSDCCSLVTLAWTSVCLNPFLAQVNLPFISEDVGYLTGGGPHSVCSNITCWITVYITAERCLCIALPLKIKQILTPRKTILIVCSVYLLMILSSAPENFTVYLGWRFYPEFNKTLIGINSSTNKHALRGFVFILGAVFGIVSFSLVVILTLVLIINLKQKNTWRKKSVTPQSSKAEAQSIRDKKTILMVVLIAGCLIMCFTPTVALKLAVFFVPDFSFYGRYSNIFDVFWSFAFIFEAINASTSIFFYYTMSSRYRQIFLQRFDRFTRHNAECL